MRLATPQPIDYDRVTPDAQETLGAVTLGKMVYQRTVADFQKIGEPRFQALKCSIYPERRDVQAELDMIYWSSAWTSLATRATFRRIPERSTKVSIALATVLLHVIPIFAFGSVSHITVRTPGSFFRHASQNRLPKASDAIADVNVHLSISVPTSRSPVPCRRPSKALRDVLSFLRPLACRTHPHLCTVSTEFFVVTLCVRLHDHWHRMICRDALRRRDGLAPPNSCWTYQIGETIRYWLVLSTDRHQGLTYTGLNSDFRYATDCEADHPELGTMCDWPMARMGPKK
ncbi:hypothetical protein BS47DRAFT_1393188 [Hydnum rufescens UP504]|uniref:Uncharacterized protein n=1 Tax=Hydnum rufescens UP504 TaxID=1448309 RepID=A0A9P6DTV6_9AGAM|nr:hypothetical protein BS47DRAFT_1393188 [Hydnum rufescens UP504]